MLEKSKALGENGTPKLFALYLLAKIGRFRDDMSFMRRCVRGVAAASVPDSAGGRVTWDVTWGVQSFRVSLTLRNYRRSQRNFVYGSYIKRHKGPLGKYHTQRRKIRCSSAPNRAKMWQRALIENFEPVLGRQRKRSVFPSEGKSASNRVFLFLSEVLRSFNICTGVYNKQASVRSKVEAADGTDVPRCQGQRRRA